MTRKLRREKHETKARSSEREDAKRSGAKRLRERREGVALIALRTPDHVVGRAAAVGERRAGRQRLGRAAEDRRQGGQLIVGEVA